MQTVTGKETCGRTRPQKSQALYHASLPPTASRRTAGLMVVAYQDAISVNAPSIRSTSSRITRIDC